MATRHSHRIPVRVQVTKPEPKREIVVSQGREHPTDGILGYLRDASDTSLTMFGIKTDAGAAEKRRQFTDIVQEWIDAEALKLFVRWQQAQPRELNDRKLKVSARRRLVVPLPKDITELDPFFRPEAESIAIRSGQTPSQLMIWAGYFEKWGCLFCKEHTRHMACGLCAGCYQRVRSRRSDIEMNLRIEFARERAEGDPRARA